MGSPLGELPYQTVGNLRLTFPSGGAATDYHRELDLTTAVALTRYTRDGVTYTRETFASAADQVIVVRLTADHGRPDLLLRRLRQPAVQLAVHSPDPLTIGLDGTAETVDGIAGQVRFRALATVRATGGSVTSQNGTLTVTGADAVTLLVSIGTNYTSYQDLNGDQNARALDPAAGGAATGPTTSCVPAMSPTTSSTSTGPPWTWAPPRPPSSPRTSGWPASRGGDDPQLVSLFFQFGRYLLISSSRPGTQPANLQGIWNDPLRPSWDSKYTVNINTEMNYWPAGPANLIELMEPVLRAGGGSVRRRRSRPRASSTAPAAGCATTTPTAGAAPRRSTVRCGACGRPAGPGWRCMSGSTTASPATSTPSVTATRPSREPRSSSSTPSSRTRTPGPW